jgi:hypothetical protein
MLLLSNGSEGAARRIARAVAPGVETVEEPWDGWGDEIYEKIIVKKWEFMGV